MTLFLTAPIPPVPEASPAPSTACPCRTPPACSLSLTRLLHPTLHTLGLACSGIFCFFCIECFLALPMSALSVQPQLRPAPLGGWPCLPRLAAVLPLHASLLGTSCSACTDLDERALLCSTALCFVCLLPPGEMCDGEGSASVLLTWPISDT